jgi:hypothetical protein
VDAVVVIGVLAVRFVAPLLIIRFPLPAILVCLVADAVDQTIFQAFLPGDLAWYQSYDKSLDVYYLSFAYISTMTNWHDERAFRVSRVLFFWRLVGVTLFEIFHWRPLLLLFPNTFEYFFIAYETIRTRWNPERLAVLTVVMLAAGITIFVKLPQETWIHVLELDLTDALAAHDELVVLMVAVLVVLGALAFVTVRRAPDPDWELTFAVRNHLDPRPDLGTRLERFVDEILVEKLAFLTLVGVVLAHIVPELSVSNARLATSVALLVLLNTAVTEWWRRRRGRGWSTVPRELAVVLLVNLVLLALVPEVLLGNGFPEEDSFLLVIMLSLMSTLFDRSRDTRPPPGEPVRPFREARHEWSERRAAVRRRRVVAE